MRKGTTAFPAKVLRSCYDKVSFLSVSIDEKQATTKELGIWQFSPIDMTPFRQQPDNSSSQYVKNENY